MLTTYSKSDQINQARFLSLSDEDELSEEDQFASEIWEELDASIEDDYIDNSQYQTEFSSEAVALRFQMSQDVRFSVGQPVPEYIRTMQMLIDGEVSLGVFNRDSYTPSDVSDRFDIGKLQTLRSLRNLSYVPELDSELVTFPTLDVSDHARRRCNLPFLIKNVSGRKMITGMGGIENVTVSLENCYMGLSTTFKCTYENSTHGRDGHVYTLIVGYVEVLVNGVVAERESPTVITGYRADSVFNHVDDLPDTWQFYLEEVKEFEFRKGRRIDPELLNLEDMAMYYDNWYGMAMEIRVCDDFIFPSPKHRLLALSGVLERDIDRIYTMKNPVIRAILKWYISTLVLGSPVKTLSSLISRIRLIPQSEHFALPLATDSFQRKIQIHKHFLRLALATYTRRVVNVSGVGVTTSLSREHIVANYLSSKMKRNSFFKMPDVSFLFFLRPLFTRDFYSCYNIKDQGFLRNYNMMLQIGVPIDVQQKIELLNNIASEGGSPFFILSKLTVLVRNTLTPIVGYYHPLIYVAVPVGTQVYAICRSFQKSTLAGSRLTTMLDSRYMLDEIPHV